MEDEARAVYKARSRSYAQARLRSGIRTRSNDDDSSEGSSDFDETPNIGKFFESGTFSQDGEERDDEESTVPSLDFSDQSSSTSDSSRSSCSSDRKETPSWNSVISTEQQSLMGNGTMDWDERCFPDPEYKFCGVLF